MSVIVAVMGIFISMIQEEETITVSYTPKRWTHKRVRIARDREAVASENRRCRKGHLPAIRGSYGPNRKARRAADVALQARGKERVRLLQQEKEEQLKKAALNSNRLRSARRWAEKGTPKSSSVRRKSVVKSADFYESRSSGLTKAQIRNRNLNAWTTWSTKRKERRSSKQERKSWALLESRCFQAIQGGDSSPTTMALYHAARSAA